LSCFTDKDGWIDGVISIGVHGNGSALKNGTTSVILTFVNRPVNDKITRIHKGFTVQIRENLHYTQLANKRSILISLFCTHYANALHIYLTSIPFVRAPVSIVVVERLP
jgi:hypothetical protein